MGTLCGTNVEEMNAYTVMLGKIEGKSSLRIPGCRCVDNIKMNLRRNGMDDMDWIDLYHDRDK
jgi:hypothetical protein